MPLGVEFSGGTIVIVSSISSPDITQVRDRARRALPGVGQNALVQRYGDPASNQVMIRVPRCRGGGGRQI